MRICFLLERGSPPRMNPIIAGTFELLGAKGAHIDVVYAEEELLRLDKLAVTADLYLLKSDTELSLSLATALERLGAQVLNSSNSCILAKDKVLAATVMARAGIPAPHAVVASAPLMLTEELSEGPLILKPHRGYHGAGVSVVEGPASLPGPAAYPEFVFAQEYLSKAKKDLKIFGIGEEVFGVRKDFSPDSFTKSGEPCVLPPAIEETAKRCARAFGLELFGIDIAEMENEVYVIDVNYFPGYRGVPDAPRRLADYILARVKGEGG